MASPGQSKRECGSQAELVARLRSGDELAFEELVRTHGPKVLSAAERILSNHEEAREVTQEAFLAAFKGIQSFRESAQLSTWLHRIVANAALMRVRKRNRRAEVFSLEDSLPVFRVYGGHFASPAVPWESEALQQLERSELQAQVRACIARLPDLYREALLLRDVEGYSNQEVAAALDVNPTTAKVRVHRARQALRTLLERHVLGDKS